MRKAELGARPCIGRFPVLQFEPGAQSSGGAVIVKVRRSGLRQPLGRGRLTHGEAQRRARRDRMRRTAHRRDARVPLDLANGDSSILIAVLAVILADKGVAALQKAGLLDTWTRRGLRDDPGCATADLGLHQRGDTTDRLSIRCAQLEFSIFLITYSPPSRSTSNRILAPGVNAVSIAGSLTRNFMVMVSM